MAKKRTSNKATKRREPSSPAAQRLNKILAAAGLGSRRKVEELIEQGRVEIDGQVVTDLACKVEPAAVKIKVDGSLLRKSRTVYYALNKPPGVLSTNYDPSGRMRVIDLVPDKDRVFSVGRLDQSSEGLMLLTNDGELAQRLAHPKFKIQKAYFVVVSGQMDEDELNKLRKGVHLAEGFARIDGATIKKVRKGCTELEIVLSEGKNREIRRILARAGHKVVLLRRIAIGPLRLGQMPVGASRTLTSSEVKALYAVTDPANREKQKTVKKATQPSSIRPSSIRPSSAKASTTARPLSTVGVDDEDDDDLLSLSLDEADDDFSVDVSGEGVGSVLGFDDDVATPHAPQRAAKPRDTGPYRNAKVARAKTLAVRNSTVVSGRPGRKTSSAKSPYAKQGSNGPGPVGKGVAGKGVGGKGVGGRGKASGRPKSAALGKGKSMGKASDRPGGRGGRKNASRKKG